MKKKALQAVMLVLLFVGIAVVLPRLLTHYQMYHYAVNGYKRLGTEQYYNLPSASEVLKQVILYGALLVMLIIPACIIIMKTILYKAKAQSSMNKI